MIYLERMSLVRTYTPKTLYMSTLRLVNTLFHHPPTIESEASHSYFKAIMYVHQAIRQDLNTILPEVDKPSKPTTIAQVHSSLSELEQQLFGTQTDFTVNIRGCYLYTRALEERLSFSKSTCCLL